MSFNPDLTKPAHEVVFSHKRNETHHHLLLLLNSVPFKRVPFHKHLGLILDSKLDFNEHIRPRKIDYLFCVKLEKSRCATQFI